MSTSAVSSMNSSNATATSTAAATAASASSGHSMSGGMSMGADSCKISMLWNWNTIDACFLTSSWHVTNNGMFAATCIGVALLVVCLELFRRIGKEYDSMILRQFQRNVAARAAVLTACGTSESGCAGPQYAIFRATPLQQLIRAVIHAITFGIAYIVMLLAMYYNGYLIICIFVGAGLGKFLCDWLVLKVAIDGSGQASRMKGEEENTFCCG